MKSSSPVSLTCDNARGGQTFVPLLPARGLGWFRWLSGCRQSAALIAGWRS